MSAPRDASFGVLTYNVHSCIGTDWKLDLGRVADVIAASGAQVVALQEIDVGRRRTNSQDQAELLAERLRMTAHFYPALQLGDERYGDAILTALPAQFVKAGPLPSIGEQRGAVWIRVEFDGVDINVINTHLGLRGRDRLRQVAHLLGPDWIGSDDFQSSPSVFCGDLNAVASSPVHALLGRHFRNAHLLAHGKIVRTFPSRMPLLGIDHIFISEGIGVVDCTAIVDPLTRRASDHLPLVAQLVVQPPNAVSPSRGLDSSKGRASPS